jgi:transcriptional regulator with XRE-family HTH domain
MHENNHNNTPLSAAIEQRRTAFGLTRAEVATRVGVTVQTIHNVERDPNYNISLHLLQKLEPILRVRFDIKMHIVQEEHTMIPDMIHMGNDFFILYIRTNYPTCTLTTQQLGKRIWIWLRDNDPDATKLGGSEPCIWGEGEHVREDRLPKNATRFAFNRSILPQLFSFLDQIALNNQV